VGTFVEPKLKLAVQGARLTLRQAPFFVAWAAFSDTAQRSETRTPVLRFEFLIDQASFATNKRLTRNPAS